MKALMRRLAILGALLVAVTGLSVHAQVDTYPNRPIKLVVGGPAGGAADVIARAVAHGIERRLGQSVVVDNRPGASMMIATQYVATAPADGYTILLTYSSPFTVLPPAYKKPLSYSYKDFVSIGLVGESVPGLMVGGSSPIKSLAEYVASAKSSPGKITFGSPGIAQMYALSMDIFQREAAIKLRQVPYNGGPPAVMAAVAGEIDSVYMDFPTADAFIRSGKLRLLAVAGKERLAAYPNVPTFAEAGFPQPGLPRVWIGIVGPKGTPKPIVEKLHAAITETVRTPELRETFAKLSLSPLTGKVDAIDALVESDTQGWGSIVKQIGLTLD